MGRLMKVTYRFQPAFCIIYLAITGVYQQLVLPVARLILMFLNAVSSFQKMAEQKLLCYAASKKQISLSKSL